MKNSMNSPTSRARNYEVIAGSLYVTRTPPLLHQEVLGGFLVEMLGWDGAASTRPGHPGSARPATVTDRLRRQPVEGGPVNGNWTSVSC